MRRVGHWFIPSPFLVGRIGICSADSGRQAQKALKKTPKAIAAAVEGTLSADPEAESYFQMSLTKWIWAETYLRNGGDAKKANALFVAALDAQDAPLDLYFVSALAQMKNGNAAAAKALMWEALMRFDNDNSSILYPLALATIGPNPKGADAVRASFILSGCLLTANIGK